MKTPIQVFFADHSFVALGIWNHERKKTFFLWRTFSLVQMRSVRKCFCLILTHRLRQSPPPRGRGLSCGSRILGLCLWLREEWQGGKYTAKSESSRNRETNQIEKPNMPTQKGSVAMCIEFWLMPGTLIFDWFMCLALNKSGSYRAVCSYIL